MTEYRGICNYNLSIHLPISFTLDMFAIPDYASGATEHWGIITYREARLLYTPGVSTTGNQRSTASIIAHECAHLVGKSATRVIYVTHY